MTDTQESVSQIAFHSYERKGRETSWGWGPLAMNLEVLLGGGWGGTRDYRLSLEQQAKASQETLDVSSEDLPLRFYTPDP